MFKFSFDYQNQDETQISWKIEFLWIESMKNYQTSKFLRWVFLFIAFFSATYLWQWKQITQTRIFVKTEKHSIIISRHKYLSFSFTDRGLLCNRYPWNNYKVHQKRQGNKLQSVHFDVWFDKWFVRVPLHSLSYMP